MSIMLPDLSQVHSMKSVKRSKINDLTQGSETWLNAGLSLLKVKESL